MESILRIGSNDGIACWVNSALVHSNLNTGRELKLGQDDIRVSLKKGLNQILLKIANMGGKWEVCLQINDLFDQPIAKRETTDNVKNRGAEQKAAKFFMY